MHEVFEGNLRSDEAGFKQLAAFRAYLVDLRKAIVARRNGQSEPAQPPVDDQRMASFPRFPNLAPYEAAREKGTIALLPTDRIKKTDLLNARFRVFDLECRAILDGVRNEDELVSYITPRLIKESGFGETQPQERSGK